MLYPSHADDKEPKHRYNCETMISVAVNDHDASLKKHGSNKKKGIRLVATAAIEVHNTYAKKKRKAGRK